MNKVLSFFISFITMIITVIYYLTYKTDRTDFFFEEKINILISINFIIAIILIISLTTIKREKSRIFSIDGIKIEYDILKTLIENILKEKQEILKYKVEIKNKNKEVSIEVSIKPNLEYELSFVEINKLIKEQVAKKTKEVLTIENLNINVTFVDLIKK